MFVFDFTYVIIIYLLNVIESIRYEASPYGQTSNGPSKFYSYFDF
jgi:hypothetical protein